MTDDTEYKDTDTRPLERFYGLVIRDYKQGEEAGKVKRFGWMSLEKVEGYKITEDERNWRTITLV